MSMPNWLQPKLTFGYENTADALRARALAAEADARKACTQAAFWRARAIEAGVGEDEWRTHMAKLSAGKRDANFDRRTGTLLSDDVQAPDERSISGYDDPVIPAGISPGTPQRSIRLQAPLHR